jgi:hypothetical protein
MADLAFGAGHILEEIPASYEFALFFWESHDFIPSIIYPPQVMETNAEIMIMTHLK